MTRSIVWVSSDDRLAVARDKLEQHRIHHLLVLDARVLVGVLSDRDVLRAMSPFLGQLSERPQDRQVFDRKVHQIMTRKLVTASPPDDVRDAAARMLLAGVSSLPVVDEHGEAVGIVTWRDMLGHALHLTDEPSRWTSRGAGVHDVPDARESAEP
jgi:acetoin utilization protein AcuB